jgi:hypothetical protein
MNARERKPKRGAFLGGHWEIKRCVARALGPFIGAFDYFIDSVEKFSSTPENRIILKSIR